MGYRRRQTDPSGANPISVASRRVGFAHPSRPPRSGPFSIIAPSPRQRSKRPRAPIFRKPIASKCRQAKLHIKSMSASGNRPHESAAAVRRALTPRGAELRGGIATCAQMEESRRGGGREAGGAAARDAFPSVIDSHNGACASISGATLRTQGWPTA